MICDNFAGIDTDKDDKINARELQVCGNFKQNIATLVNQFVKKHF